jgi:hypothetical protein
MMPVNRNPSASDLRWFGILFVVFAGLVGGMAAWRHRAIVTEAEVIWAVGVVVGLLYFAVPPLQRPLYVGWMYAVFPIGWTVSHALMAVIYYGVFTPIGFVLRSTGRDTLDKGFDRSARSYWVRYTPQRDVGRYFKQF